jgi:polyhydroxybutyrate depolymerase
LILRVILFILIFSARSAAAQPPGTDPSKTTVLETMEQGNLLRSYMIHVPKSYREGSAVALIIALHGEGADAATMEEMTDFSKLSEKEGFIVVYPNGAGPFPDKYLTWNAGHCCGWAWQRDVDDLGFIAALLERLNGQYTLDPDRLYVTGFSNGGMLAYKIACEYSEKFAAIGVVAASMPERCLSRAVISVIAFHGEKDRYVPYKGGVPPILYDELERHDMPVMETMAFWGERDGCETKGWRSENSKYIRDIWSHGLNDTEVRLYTLKDAGHAWPGAKPIRYLMDEPSTDLEASVLMWDFFRTHPKKSLIESVSPQR